MARRMAGSPRGSRSQIYGLWQDRCRECRAAPLPSEAGDEPVLQRSVRIDDIGGDVPHVSRFLASPLPKRFKGPRSQELSSPMSTARDSVFACARMSASQQSGRQDQWNYLATMHNLQTQGGQRDRGILAVADRNAVRLDQRIEKAPDIVSVFLGQEPIGRKAVQAGIEHIFRMRPTSVWSLGHARTVRSSVPRN